MPIIGIDSYSIDFVVLETNNPKTITLLDQSRYLTDAEKPLLSIIVPGFTGHVEIPYYPNTLITLTSDDVGLTEPTDYEDLADLPDGIYQITMKVCPYDELYSKKCHLKSTLLQCSYQKLLLGLDSNSSCIDNKKLKEEIIDIDILIQSAKAETNICNVEKAMFKYQAAVKKIENLNKKLNCK